MPTAGPYGITQFDAPGIIGAYQNAQQNRIQMMLQQKQLEQLDADAKRTATTAAAWSKVVGKPPASKAVDAYGTKPEAAPAPTAPADPLAVLPDAQATPAAPAAPTAAPAGPADSINREAVPELLSALGPDQGVQFLEHWQKLDEAQQKAVAEHNEDLGQALGWADTPEKWDQAVDHLAQQNPALAKYKGHFDQRGKAAMEVGAISAFVKASKPNLMNINGSVIDENHPEKGAVFTAPADYHQFSVHNADGTDTPYGFDPKTGRTFQLRDGGGPAADTGGAPGGFDHAVEHVLANEGGYNPSDMNGAPVNFGINQKANPGVDVQHMTKDQAKQIYHDKYWVPSGAESLPANLQAPYFDVYIRNPAFAKKALAESGGDAGKFMQASSAYFQALAKKPNGQRYARAWAARDAKNMAIATGGGGSPISGKPLSANPDTEETAQFIGGQVALGQPMPPLGMGKEAAAMRRAILAEATKQWKAMGISPGEANVIAAENKSGLAELAKIAQMKATVQTAENTASANATQVLTLLGSAGSTGSPIFNAWQQAGRRATGDAKVSAFDVAVKTLSTEYARVMSGSGSTQLSDAARHEADALIHTSMTPDQFRAAIKQMKIDMANRTKGIEQERQATLTQIRSGGRATPHADEGWQTLPSGLKVRRVQ